MILKIITPENIIFDNNNIKSITVTTESGVVTILDNHEPLISVIKTGEITIKENKDKKINEIKMTINSGFLEVRPKEFSENNKFEVVLLTEESLSINDLDIEEINKAKERAEIAMKKEVSDIEFARLEGVLERELNKIKIFHKYRPTK